MLVMMIPDFLAVPIMLEGTSWFLNHYRYNRCSGSLDVPVFNPVLWIRYEDCRLQIGLPCCE